MHHKNNNISRIHMNVIYLNTKYFSLVMYCSTASSLYERMNVYWRLFCRCDDYIVCLLAFAPIATSLQRIHLVLACSSGNSCSLSSVLELTVRFHFAMTCPFWAIAMSFICIIDIFCLLKELFSGTSTAMHQFLAMNFILAVSCTILSVFVVYVPRNYLTRCIMFIALIDFTSRHYLQTE